MGMPISCFSTLLGIRGNSRYVSQDAAQRILQKYRTIAFVIHDPGVHTDFDAALISEFDRLDHESGSSLLFFALVRPESAMIEGLVDRAYYRLFADHAREVGGMVDEELIPVSRDPSITAFTFAAALGIQPSELPCIVTTDNLLSDRVEIHGTSAGALREQLRQLGYRAAREPAPGPRPQHYPLFEKESQDEEDGDHRRLSRSLAETLTAVLGPLAIGSKYGGQEAKRGVGQALRSLERDLERVRLRHDGEQGGEFDRLACAIAGIRWLVKTREQRNDVETVFSNPPAKFFDHDTCVMFKTGAGCLEALDYAVMADPIPPERLNRFPAKGDGRRRPEVDFTPGLICMAKGFEREMNLSVVQWVRQRLGVSLPDYYDRPQQGIVAQFTPSRDVVGGPMKGTKIDFNVRRGRKWLPPGLGQSELACLELASPNPPAPFDAESWRFLMAEWRTIVACRNQAAHALVGRDKCDRVISALKKLMTQEGFGLAASLKLRLSGRA